MALTQQQQRQIMVFQPQNTMPSPQQQQNIAFQPQLTMPVTPHFRCGPRHGSVDPYGFPHQQLPTAGQDLQFQGAFLQHDMHADCHSAANKLPSGSIEEGISRGAGEDEERDGETP